MPSDSEISDQGFHLSRHLPILGWGRVYTRLQLTGDLLAAVIVTIMLIPQSLAYAMIAGLPPQMGLYASVLPLIAYAIFGTSRTLAVGPVAVLSLMTAVAAGSIAAQGSSGYIEAAMLLAVLSGGILLIMGLLRLGFLANFLSHPVISGFITATGILIAAGQVKHILGIDAGGHNLFEIIASLVAHLPKTNIPTLIIGSVSLAFLFWVKTGLKSSLVALGIGETPARIIARTGPVFAVAAGIGVVALWSLADKGVAIVGEIPQGLPTLSIPRFDQELWTSLLGSAALISVIGFVESISVAQTLATKRRQRIQPDQELIGLGASSLASGLSSGFPVTGGFARSAVNFDAGAETPAAGAFTAIGIALAALFLTPLLYFLPKAVLAATIIIAVLSLVDFKALRQTWRYSKNDFAAMLATILMTLGLGVEIGITTGVALSIFLHLYQSSKPHFAIVGRVPGTEHFRNVLRHDVITCDRVLTVRMDASLYFANARFLEDTIYDLISRYKGLQHLVLMCPTVSVIDASALESLEAINQRLEDAGIQFHLSEVKGPVMDRLKRTDFLEHLTGRVFLNQYQAIKALDPNPDQEPEHALSLIHI